MLMVLPLQLLAYHVPDLLGTDVINRATWQSVTWNKELNQYSAVRGVNADRRMSFYRKNIDMNTEKTFHLARPPKR
jgi:hypothetical protein